MTDDRYDSHLLPIDSGWRADKALITELSKLNTQVTRYVLRYLDADARRAEPISAEDERALADQLATLAATLQARADRRAALGDAPLAIEGGVTPPPVAEDDTHMEP